MKRIALMALTASLIACSSAPPAPGNDDITLETNTLIVGLHPTATTANANGMPLAERVQAVMTDATNQRTNPHPTTNTSGENITIVPVIDGFMVHDGSEELRSALESDPRVAFTEWDSVIAIAESTSVTPPSTPVTWGIDRVNQRALPLDAVFDVALSGRGVTMYIVDSGVRATHSEFSGRVTKGATTIFDGRGTDDCNGHGTHVAATAGGRTFGVARAVTIVPVRVLNCNGGGLMSDGVKGLNWVFETAKGPSVVNVSLGGGGSTAFDSAVRALFGRGIVTVVAAGNSNANACNYSPGREPRSITVTSSTRLDVRADYSNFGSCVDVFAPGDRITSASHTSDTGSITLSGTSMAAPHVAGIAALHLENDPTWTAQQLTQLITHSATTNVVTNAGSGTPNRLVFIDPKLGFTAPPEPEPEPEPELKPSCEQCSIHAVTLTSESPVAFTAATGAPYGTHTATIMTANDATADVELQQLIDGVWKRIARITNATSGTKLTATTASGTHRYRIASNGAFGAFILTSRHAISSSVNVSGGNYVTSSFQLNSITQHGYLVGPAGTNFDLRLERLEGTLWRPVAASLSLGSEEYVAFPATSGHYRWRIQSRSGTGAFTFTTWTD